MISPEQLRKYPFFAGLTDDQLMKIAIGADEASIPAGKNIFEEGQPAEFLYLLMRGSVDLYFSVLNEDGTAVQKEFLVGEINPSEPFGISALLEPYLYTATSRSAKDSQVIKLDSQSLRNACQGDRNMAYALLLQIAKELSARLHFTRIQLAAARG